MHSERFDEILTRLAAEPSRRTALKGIVGSLSAAGLLGVALDDTDAKPHGKKTRKRKQRREKKAKRRDKRRDSAAATPGEPEPRHNRKKRKNGNKVKDANGVRCKSYASKCGSKKRCYDLRSDPKHCGSCTVACAPGEACVSGVCIGS